MAVSTEVFEGRVDPKSPQTTQGAGLSRLTGKKKKKSRQGQPPGAVLQPADAGASVDAPEMPSAMDVEVEELLPLPEVGAAATLSSRACKSLSKLDLMTLFSVWRLGGRVQRR